MKKLSTLILSMLMLFSVSIVAFAKEPEPIINSAIFDVEFERNGDAVITETWNVSYPNKVEIFSKDIYKSITYLESIEDIKYDKFYINGEECESAITLNEERNFETLNWISKKDVTYENNTVEFKVKYTLKNVVKSINNEYPVFCYRFVTNSFKDEIGTIEIYFRNLDKINLRYGTYDRVETGNDFVKIIKTNSSDLTKYNVVIDKSYFDELQFISGEDMEEQETKDLVLPYSTRQYAIFFSISFVIITTLYIVISKTVKEILHRKHFAKKIEKLPNYMEDKVIRVAELNRLTSTDVSVIRDEKLNPMNFFRLTLFDLCRREYATIGLVGISLVKNQDRIREHEKDVLNLIVKYGDNVDYEATNVIPLAKFVNNLKDKKVYKKFSKDLTQVYNKYYETKHKELKNLSNYPELKFLMKEFEYFFKKNGDAFITNTTTDLYHITRFNNPNYLKLVSYIYVKKGNKKHTNPKEFGLFDHILTLFAEMFDRTLIDNYFKKPKTKKVKKEKK